MSAIIDVGWNNPAREAFTFARPAVAPPAEPNFLPSAVIGRTTERKGWTLSIGQGTDLVTRGRWRPWVGGELLVDDVAEHYDQTAVIFSDPMRPSVFATDRDDFAIAGAVVAGIKIYVGPRLFLTADETFRRYFTNASVSQATTRWRLGIGVKLGPAE